MLNLFQSILKVLTTGREYGGRSNCRLKFVEAFQRCQVELFAHNNMGSGNSKKKVIRMKISGKFYKIKDPITLPPCLSFWENSGTFLGSSWEFSANIFFFIFRNLLKFELIQTTFIFIFPLKKNIKFMYCFLRFSKGTPVKKWKQKLYEDAQILRGPRKSRSKHLMTISAHEEPKNLPGSQKIMGKVI